MLRSFLPLACLTLALFFLTGPVDTARAQQRQGNTGVGAQVGAPTGLTVRIYDRAPFIYDFLAAWDLDEFFFLSVHGLDERALEDSPLNYFYGPGFIFGVDTRGRDNELVLGISATGGINYFVESFEVFLQVAPRFEVIPATSLDLGGGIGLRYYFGR